MSTRLHPARTCVKPSCRSIHQQAGEQRLFSNRVSGWQWPPAHARGPCAHRDGCHAWMIAPLAFAYGWCGSVVVSMEAPMGVRHVNAPPPSVWLPHQ